VFFEHWIGILVEEINHSKKNSIVEIHSISKRTKEIVFWDLWSFH
jgi:hypothetical protein